MPAPESPRASPEALLDLAKREGRGRLKISLGASPGVGKTFAMLLAARTAKADGRDTVIGLVETHGRTETEALVGGLEIIPRKAIVYRNRVIQEFDLDAALARHPQLLLVDEYAHSNVPGSRHPKRWNDVAELLAAGIDVWTTLNVQHLESLNDVIQQITKVRVRETLPDVVFEEADEVVLVDLPVDELLRRLAEGRVYVQETAAQAVQSFFKPENLTALRELALRRAAERIDADLVERMRAQAIEGPWPASERILACIGPDPVSRLVVRTAKRMADLMDANWIAATVEAPGADSAASVRAAATLAFAESLGAETRTLIGNDLPSELLRLARSENLTQIVVGRSQPRGIFGRLRRSLPHELLRRADDVAVHVVTARPELSAATTIPATSRGRRAMFSRQDLLPYAGATAGIAAAVAVGEVLTGVSATGFPNLSVVFLAAVVLTALWVGTGPAVWAAVLSFLAYNFFFVAPLYSFTVAQPHELLALILYLFVSLSVSTLAGSVRRQSHVASEHMRAIRRLYDYTRKLSGMTTSDAVVEAAASEIHADVGRPTVVLIGDKDNLDLRASWPPEDALDTASLTAARWARANAEPAGAGTDTLPNAPWLFIPLRTARKLLGVIGTAQRDGFPPLDPEARAVLETLAEQTAAALDRVALAGEIVSTRAAAETERVRNTLLASISHDFRTPLAAILGSATSLIDYSERLTPAAQSDLLRGIRLEAEHLDELVRGLLSMTRIDAGALEVRLDWVDVREVATRVAGAARRRGALQTIALDLPADLPLISADATLVEQALDNLVGNAIIHTPPETHVMIDALVEPAAITIRVTDNGPGISAELLPRVFEKFARTRPDRETHKDGAGLGLAIAKGIVDAHGGSIAAESPVSEGRGARFVLKFPRGIAAT